MLYLLGLNAISATDPHLVHGVLDVLVFDAIWFAVPIAAFVVALRRPDLARRVIDRANAWTGRYQRQIAVVVFGVSGAYFAVRGAVDLL